VEHLNHKGILIPARKELILHIMEIGGFAMECKIRPWRLSDAPALAMALSNKKILDNLRDGLPYPYTENDAVGFISAMLGADKDKTFAYAITVDDKAVGSIGVFRRDNIHSRTAEMGYYVAEPYWGQGIGTSAVLQNCDDVFENTDIMRIFAEPFAYNAASCRILEKAGFVYEGTLRMASKLFNGKVEDDVCYSVTREDYNANR
jgi:RimJ/RimL family protein N-acetyltransferase